MNILTQRRCCQNVIIDVNDVMFENALHTQVLTLISLLSIKISPSNFQELLIEVSSFLLFKYISFDIYTLKVHFIRSWPIEYSIQNYFLSVLRYRLPRFGVKRQNQNDAIFCRHKSFDKTKNRVWFEPRHDKTNKVTVRPAKTQISLGIRPVWSESSLCAQWVAKDPSLLHADSEYPDQTRRMPRLIWVFARRTCHFVGFVTRWLICDSFKSKNRTL